MILPDETDTSEPESEFTDGETDLMVVSSLAYHVARSDGEIDEPEESFIHDHFRDAMQVRGEPISEPRLQECLWEARISARLLEMLVEAAREDSELRFDLLRHAWRILALRGRINDQAIAYMDGVAAMLQATDDEYRQSAFAYVRQTQRSETLSRARRILGVGEDATLAEIHEHFNRFMDSPPVPPRTGERPPILPSDIVLQTMAAHDHLASHLGNDLYVLAASGQQLLAAADATLCRCFFCKRPTKLPPLDQLEHARCKNCQALLAFERDWAGELFTTMKG